MDHIIGHTGNPSKDTILSQRFLNTVIHIYKVRKENAERIVDVILKFYRMCLVFFLNFLNKEQTY